MKWHIITIGHDNRHEADSIIKGINAGGILCSAGAAEIIVNDRIFRLHEHQLFIYPPYAKIATASISPDFECVALAVDHQFLLDALKSVSWSNNLQLISDNPVAAISECHSSRIYRLLDLILPLIDKSDNHLKALSAECMKRALTYEVLDTFTEQATIPAATTSTKDSIVLEFQAMLKSKYLQHRDVQYYAAMQGLTPRYFSTVIKEMTGNTASYWIIKAVIVEAQHLMLDYSISIKEITYQLNFSSQTFFSRWYKHYTGETPTQFRKRNRI